MMYYSFGIELINPTNLTLKDGAELMHVYSLDITQIEPQEIEILAANSRRLQRWLPETLHRRTPQSK